MNTAKIISLLSIAAGVCVSAMFLIAIVTGVSQEQFEISQNVESYTKNLIAAENPLRLTFTIDIVFICIFTALFVFLTQNLKTTNVVVNAIADVSLVAMLICGFLDFHEDLHILTMLHSATNNLMIEQSEINLQMLFSMIKFCASYISLFLIAFILPNNSLSEKLLRICLLFFFVPIGALVYTAPQNLHLIFNLIRFVFMAAGFFLLAYNFSKKIETT